MALHSPWSLGPLAIFLFHGTGLLVHNQINVFSCIIGKWLGSRQIRCNWATKGAASNDDKQSSDAKSVVELTNGSSGLY